MLEELLSYPCPNCGCKTKTRYLIEEIYWDWCSCCLNWGTPDDIWHCHQEERALWVSKGAKWLGEGCPENWDAREQLNNFIIKYSLQDKVNQTSLGVFEWSAE